MAADLGNVPDALKALRGVDLSGYRPDTPQRRVAAGMTQAKTTDVDKYARQLHVDPNECDRRIRTENAFRKPRTKLQKSSRGTLR